MWEVVLLEATEMRFVLLEYINLISEFATSPTKNSTQLNQTNTFLNPHTRRTSLQLTADPRFAWIIWRVFD